MHTILWAVNTLQRCTQRLCLVHMQTQERTHADTSRHGCQMWCAVNWVWREAPERSSNYVVVLPTSLLWRLLMTGSPVKTRWWSIPTLPSASSYGCCASVNTSLPTKSFSWSAVANEVHVSHYEEKQQSASWGLSGPCNSPYNFKIYDPGKEYGGSTNI